MRAWLKSAVLFLSLAGCTRTETMVSPTERPPDLKLSKAEKKSKDEPKKNPQPNTCVKAGQVFEQAGDAMVEDSIQKQAAYNQARLSYQQAVDVDPKHQPAVFGLARLLEKEGKFDEAVAKYKSCLRNDKSDAAAWFEIAMLHNRRKNFDQAVAAMAKAHELEPGNIRYANHLGWTLARAGRFEESHDVFLRSVGEGKANYNLALMTLHVGREDLCRQYLQAALRANPKMQEAQQMLARLEEKGEGVKPAAAGPQIDNLNP